MDEKLNKILSVQDLLEAMERVSPQESDEDDEETIKNYRYFLYARRSSDETQGKQMRSLGDQVAECREMAQRMGLHIIGKPILESQSAKSPDIRPHFRKMLEDIDKGKADGIIAWHPDRLARNMKDAGEIIDMVDTRKIKDLKFVCFTFENNATGKMLLGITFALSKQYSDQLSVNVKRGSERSIKEGKALQVIKHGYFKDREGFLRPDGENFILLKTAFKMRLNGATLDNIGTFLNTSGYQRAKKDDKNKDGYKHVDCKMDKKKVSLIMKDTFYTGIFLYKNKKINLIECNFGFEPIITPQEYLSINGEAHLIKEAKLSHHKGKGERKADFARGMVICDDCGMPMTAGITPKKGKNMTTNYYYFRCDTHKCPRKNKSIRGKIIIEFVIELFEKYRFDNREAYEQFNKSMNYILKEKNEEMSKRKNQLQAKLDKRRKLINDIKTTLYTETDPEYKKIYTTDLKEAIEEEKKMATELENVKVCLEQTKTSVITYEEFIELARHFANLTKEIRTIEDWDFVVRKVFLNFTIKDKKMANYTINSPFRELIESSKVSLGRSSRT